MTELIRLSTVNDYEPNDMYRWQGGDPNSCDEAGFGGHMLQMSEQLPACSCPQVHPPSVAEGLPLQPVPEWSCRHSTLDLDEMEPPAGFSLEPAPSTLSRTCTR